MTKRKKGDMPNWQDQDERIEPSPQDENIPWGVPIQISLKDVANEQQVEQNNPKQVEQQKETVEQPKEQTAVTQPTTATASTTQQQTIIKKKKRTIKEKIRLGRLKSKYITLPKGVKVPKSASDLVVITKTKDLVAYIFLVTKSCPKKFRATFISRLQNYGLNVIDELYRANECTLTKNDLSQYGKRKEYQTNAKIGLKLLEYFALLAYENECIAPKHYEQIAKQSTSCQILLANWVISDAKRVA